MSDDILSRAKAFKAYCAKEQKILAFICSESQNSKPRTRGPMRNFLLKHFATSTGTLLMSCSRTKN